MFDLAKVASEIVLRIYLTIGFTAVLGLAALAATSTDAMVRRLGRRWQRLHRLVYLIALLAVVHYWMQSKLEVWEPTIMAGIYLWLMGYRVLARFVAVRGRVPLVWVGALGVAAAVLTALGEAAYFWLAYGVDPLRVIAANWSLDTGVRPAPIVLALALAVTAAGACAGWWRCRRTAVRASPETAREDGMMADRDALLRELMAVFDELPAPLRDAINYAAEPLDPKSLATLCRKHGAGNVLAMIEMKLKRAAGRRDRQADSQARDQRTTARPRCSAAVSLIWRVSSCASRPAPAAAAATRRLWRQTSLAAAIPNSAAAWP